MGIYYCSPNDHDCKWLEGNAISSRQLLNVPSYLQLFVIISLHNYKLSTSECDWFRINSLVEVWLVDEWNIPDHAIVTGELSQFYNEK